jgi:hypothetical protein
MATGLASAPLIKSTGANILATGRDVTLTNADAKTTLVATATGGDVTLGIGLAGTTALLQTLTGPSVNGAPGVNGNVNVITSLTTGNSTPGGNATINSVGNATLQLVTSKTGGIAVTTSGSATGGTLDAQAGNTVIMAGPRVQFDTVKASGLVQATAASVLINTATATTGSLELTATSGQLTLGTGLAGTTATLTKSGTLDELQATTVTSGTASTPGTITIASGTNVRLATATSTIGSIGVTAAQDVSGIAGIGSGRANLTANSSGAAIAITASTGSALLGNLAANAALTVNAQNNAEIGSATSATSDIAVTSNQIDVRGAVTTTASGKTITLTNRSGGVANATVLGTGGSATDFALTSAEIGFLNSDNIVVQSGIQNVLITGFQIGANNGKSSFRVFALDPSIITVTGRVEDCSPAACTPSTAVSVSRVFQLGGPSAADPIISSAAGTSTNLANRIVGMTTGTGGAALDLRSFNVDLRANALVFGLPELLAAAKIDVATSSTLPVADIARTLLANPNSPLFDSRGQYGAAQPIFLRANTLAVRYRDFGLFQNTSPTGLSSGVDLGPNSANTPIGSGEPPRIKLFSTGESPANSFGIFASINGRSGRTAALLPIQVIEIAANGSLRITQVNSRLNGCVVGAPDKGCLTNDTPVPALDLFDETQANLLTPDFDTTVDFDPLTGANNESLFVDFGGFAVPADQADPCPPGTPGPCPTSGSIKP